jgi:fucose 4-O-acetylase-like acetyltransferase
MLETSRHEARVSVAQRELWVDNLRVLLIAGVIVVHTATAYILDIAGWYYEDERSTSGVWSSVLIVPAAFGALFGLGPLFFVAGWFSVHSMARRGPAGFARSRLIRLGVPIVAFVAFAEPLTDYVGNIWDESHGFGYYMGTTELSVMWFAAALLVFSLVYAAWERVRPTAASPGPLRPAAVVVAIVTIAVSSFLVGWCGRWTARCSSTCGCRSGPKAPFSSPWVSMPAERAGSSICLGIWCGGSAG